MRELYSRRTYPRRKGALSKKSIVLGRHQVATQIEQVVHFGVCAQKSLCLMNRFESTHNSFSNSRWLMRKFGSIVGILGGVVDCVRDKFSMRDTIAPKLICDDSSRFIAARSQYALEKALCRHSVSAAL